MTMRDGFCVALLPVVVKRSTLLNWRDGPLPLTAEVMSGDGTELVTASSDVRRTAFHRRVHPILYPEPGGSTSSRHHRADISLSLPQIFGAQAKIVAFDLLIHGNFSSARADETEDGQDGILCVYLDAETSRPLEFIELLWHLCRHRKGRESLAATVVEWVEDQTETIMDPQVSRPLFTLTYAAVGDGSLMESDAGAPPFSLPGTAFEDWDQTDQWTWLFSSLTLPDRFAPPRHHRSDEFGSVIGLSSTWSARVLRDGIGFVALPSEATDESRATISSLAFYARTIYVDAMLLANIQARWINELADRLSDYAEAHIVHLPELACIDRDLTCFRATVWWRSIAQGTHGDRMLRAYQQQHELNEMLASSASESAVLIRQVSSELDKKTLEATQKTTQILTLLTVLGIPAGVVLTIWQGLGGGWGRLWVCAIVALVIAATLALTLAMPTRVRSHFRIRRPTQDGVRPTRIDEQ